MNCMKYMRHKGTGPPERVCHAFKIIQLSEEYIICNAIARNHLKALFYNSF